MKFSIFKIKTLFFEINKKYIKILEMIGNVVFYLLYKYIDENIWLWKKNIYTDVNILNVLMMTIYLLGNLYD